MFTDCPSCRRQFRLRARQLSAARGWVQCGYCGEQFNALERLHDQPQPRPRVSVPVIQEEAVAEGATGNAAVSNPPDQNDDAPSLQLEQEPELEDGAAKAGNVALESEATMDEISLRLEEQTEEDAPRIGEEADGAPLWGETESEAAPLPSGAQADEVHLQARSRATIAAQNRKRPGEEPEFELPPELEPEATPQRSRLSRVLWGLAVFLLLAVTAAQVAWFNRDDLLTRYPQWMPLARQVCKYFQCSVIRHRDVSAIKLLNRDVRDHPRYQGALLVNATIANESDVIQPFPVVQLALFDTGGKLIGERKFRPDEYLDQSIDSDGGMPPGKPFHIVLEVTGPTQGAVSFEFHFLER